MYSRVDRFSDKGKILAYTETLNATQIAKKMERDPTTIRRFISKYKETGKTENLPRSGRSPTLNDDKKDALVNEATKKRRAPLHELSISWPKLRCNNC
ncbi:hypothetical protein Glove_140g69 [Diversispora epigaea]|uniref:Transposase IS30-like HTH domain-containing protein n=1 Tax=Diversispora epigaea TaxID=1348612 RepID=A0A397J1M7_9GLOM|nr:hypothetical protein Glove_140g69 [Diversispora epigaea]